MLTVNGALYKDVDLKDFYHYFADTAMMWKISPNKRRLFIVGNAYDDPKVIPGTYLTRESLFKTKTVPWNNWWQCLDPIVMQPLTFNVGNGCAFWKHSLAKNLRKSFPWKVNSIRFFGEVDAASKTAQNVASIAFGELYARPKEYPSLRHGLELQNSVACARRFILDREGKTMYYNGRAIAKLDGCKIQLFKKAAHFTSLLLREHGLESRQIDIIDTPKEEKPHQLAIPMKENVYCIPTYDPEFTRPFSGYCVYRKANYEVQYRTYIGPYPGAAKLEDGWMMYNTWSEDNWE